MRWGRGGGYGPVPHKWQTPWNDCRERESDGRGGVWHDWSGGCCGGAKWESDLSGGESDSKCRGGGGGCGRAYAQIVATDGVPSVVWHHHPHQWRPPQLAEQMRPSQAALVEQVHRPHTAAAEQQVPAAAGTSSVAGTSGRMYAKVAEQMNQKVQNRVIARQIERTCGRSECARGEEIHDRQTQTTFRIWSV